MKKIIVFIGLALILIGLRYYDDGIRRFAGGELSVYPKIESSLFLPTGANCYRLDIRGDCDISRLLDDCLAKVVFTEDNEKIIYAYTPLVCRSEWVHGMRINMMIYLGENTVSVGVPILKGSY